MEVVQSFLVEVANKFPMVALGLGALGSLVILGQMIVPLTPSKKDDEKLEELKKKPIGKLLLMLAAFAPIQKK